MIFKVKAVVKNQDGETREVSPLIAGCQNAIQAEAKFRMLYDVVKIKKVEEWTDDRRKAGF